MPLASWLEDEIVWVVPSVKTNAARTNAARTYAPKPKPKVPAIRPTDAMRYLKAKEFWVTGIIEDDLLADARGALLTGLAKGQSVGEMVMALRDKFEPWVHDDTRVSDGEVVRANRLETIIRTNTTDAYNQGRLAFGARAEGYLKGWAFTAILDTRTTEVCSGLDGKVFEADDPDLLRVTPPLHFNCFIDGQTKVFTAQGWQNIARVRKGDLVLTHKGRFRPVTFAHHHDAPVKYDGEVVKFGVAVPDRAANSGKTRPLTLTTTLGHPVLTKRGWVPVAKLTLKDSLIVTARECAHCGNLFPFVRRQGVDPAAIHCSRSCHMAAASAKVWRQPGHRLRISTKAREQMHSEYASGARDPVAITQAANARTREMVAEGTSPFQRPEVRALAQKRRLASSKWWHSITVGRMGDNNPVRKSLGAGARISASQRKYWAEHPEEHPNRKMGRAIMAGHEGYISKGQRALWMRAKRILRSAQLEYPVLAGGRRYYADVALPKARIALEYDGSHWHKDPEKDAQRDAAFTTEGWSVIRYRDRVPSREELAADIARVQANHDGEYRFMELPVCSIQRWKLRKARRLFNLSVLGDESYVVRGVVVHNCRSILSPVTINEQVEQDDWATAEDVGRALAEKGVGFNDKDTVWRRYTTVDAGLLAEYAQRYGFPDQPRDDHGRWSDGGSGSASATAAEHELAVNHLVHSDMTHGVGKGAPRLVQPRTDTAEELYAQAAKAEPHFMDTVRAHARETGGDVQFPPLKGVHPGSSTMKGRASFDRKVASETAIDPTYDHNRVVDVVRGSVVYGSVFESRKGAAAFIAANKANVVRVKDRAQNPANDGYRDILVNYKEPSTGHITEIQFHNREMLGAKNTAGRTLNNLPKYFELTRESGKSFHVAILGNMATFSTRTGAWARDMEAMDFVLYQSQTAAYNWDVVECAKAALPMLKGLNKVAKEVGE